MNRSRSAALAAILALLAGSALAAGSSATKGSTYVLRSSGNQCFRAPCPFWEAIDVATCRRLTADSIDTSAISGAERLGGLQSRFARNPVTVRGFAKPDPNGKGTVFKVLKILGRPDPRAARCS